MAQRASPPNTPSIDWGRTNTFSDLKFHGNDPVHKTSINDESNWSVMDSGKNYTNTMIKLL